METHGQTGWRASGRAKKAGAGTRWVLQVCKFDRNPPTKHTVHTRDTLRRRVHKPCTPHPGDKPRLDLNLKAYTATQHSTASGSSSARNQHAHQKLLEPRKQILYQRLPHSLLSPPFASGISRRETEPTLSRYIPLPPRFRFLTLNSRHNDVDVLHDPVPHRLHHFRQEVTRPGAQGHVWITEALGPADYRQDLEEDKTRRKEGRKTKKNAKKKQATDSFHTHTGFLIHSRNTPTPSAS